MLLEWISYFNSWLTYMILKCLVVINKHCTVCIVWNIKWYVRNTLFFILNTCISKFKTNTIKLIIKTSLIIIIFKYTVEIVYWIFLLLVYNLLSLKFRKFFWFIKDYWRFLYTLESQISQKSVMLQTISLTR